MILIQASDIKKITIEGNMFYGGDFERDDGQYNESEFAINLDGVDSATIRNNFVEFVNNGINAYHDSTKMNLNI